jgi:hypothetical protein
MGTKLLTVGQENAIFRSKPQGKDGKVSGPSWISLGAKYGVAPGTTQRAWARANLRKMNK